MPKVSIILPTYNGSEYLRESINSIIAQKFSDWELIIVDDCSHDMTPEIIREYNEIDNRIRVIHNKENKKLPQSLNIGFSQARGEYLTWTSDDNIYHEDAIAKMARYLDNHVAIGMVCCDMFCIDREGNIIEYRVNDPKNLWVYDSIGACFMYRKSVKDKVGEYNPDMFLAEDYDYWLRVNKCYEIGHISESLYYYRYHELSLTGSRQASIRKQLNKLRIKYLDDILIHLYNNTEGLASTFADMYSSDTDNIDELSRKFEHAGLTQKLIKSIKREKKYSKDKKCILFGAGDYGRKALEYFGHSNVYCFVDNNREKQGNIIKGKAVISREQLKEIHDQYNIIITVDLRKAYILGMQLEEMGIEDYSIFVEILRKASDEGLKK